MGCKEMEVIKVEELQGTLQGILREPHSLNLFLVLRDGDNYSLRKANIEHEKTEPWLRELFSNSIKERIINAEDLIVRKLSDGDDGKNVIYQYDYEDYSKELSLFCGFDINFAVDLDDFDFSKDDIGKLFGYFVYIGSMDKGVLLFKKHYQITLVKSGRGFMRLSRKGGCLEKVPEEDMIRLNDDFQLFKVCDKLFVLNISVLERSMGFFELIRKAAKEAVSLIDGLNIVDDVKKLDGYAGDFSFARKLSQVRYSSPIVRMGIDAGQIISFTKNHPELKSEFKYTDDGAKIKLESKDSCKAFLKLMNDSYLRSELTKLLYETQQKDVLVDR